jgi:four helix bundle protein
MSQPTATEGRGLLFGNLLAERILAMFIAYEVSIDLIRALRPLVPSVRRYNADLADQLHRAATSVALNLAEGRRRRAGNQRRSFEIAHGEASEVRACLDVVEAWGWIVDSQLPLQILDRLLALLWRRSNGRAAPRAELPSVASTSRPTTSTPA